MVNLVMVCVGTVCVHEVFVGDNNYYCILWAEANKSHVLNIFSCHITAHSLEFFLQFSTPPSFLDTNLVWQF